MFEALSKAGGSVYSNYAVGFNNVNVQDANKHNIAVGNTPGVCTCIVDQQTVNFVTYLCRAVQVAFWHIVPESAHDAETLMYAYCKVHSAVCALFAMLRTLHQRTADSSIGNVAQLIKLACHAAQVS